MAAEWFILRATLQSAAPLIIDGGEADALTDTDPVRDWNGLPMLPASALAGALRAAVGTRADAWFGFQKGNTGQRSAVKLTDGLFHWSDDRPRDGLIVKPAGLQAMRDDPVCRHVLPGQRPLTREHVRLNDHGVVQGDGKFSRDAVPTGARFTFELRTQDREAAAALQALIVDGLFLGGATRAGYGELTCVAIGQETLTLPRDWDRWCAIMGAGLETARGIPMAPVGPGQAAQRVWAVSGTIEGPLLIGSGGRSDKEDRAPWREPQFRWTGQGGGLERDVFVIPGSAIKGPVRHRTLYHLRKADPATADNLAKALFGEPAKGNTGAAGLLRFHDCAVPEATQTITQTHVGLDRFTGGPRRGVLFTDATLWQPELALRITELRPDAITDAQRAALKAALNDLACGLLGLGAEWGEGAGVFRDAIVTPPAAVLQEGDADAA